MNHGLVRPILAPLAGVVTLIVGTAIVAVLTPMNLAPPESAQPAKELVNEILPTPRVEVNKDEFDNHDDLGCWGDENEHPKFGPIRLSPDRILTTLCGMLFVHDRKGELIWKRNTYAPLTDEPKLIDEELVIIGFDLHLWGIDPNTGERNWAFDAN